MRAIQSSSKTRRSKLNSQKNMEISSSLHCKIEIGGKTLERVMSSFYFLFRFTIDSEQIFLSGNSWMIIIGSLLSQ